MLCRITRRTARPEVRRGIRDTWEVRMKTHGETEAAVCEATAGVEQDYTGRGPNDIHAYLFRGPACHQDERRLDDRRATTGRSLPAEKGRDLVKQVRNHLVETARPAMGAMIQEITGVRILSLHHDISTVTGEEVVLFTLAESPIFREAGRGRPNHRSYSGFAALCSNQCGDSFWYRRERRGNPQDLAFSVTRARMGQSRGVLSGKASRDAIG